MADAPEIDLTSDLDAAEEIVMGRADTGKADEPAPCQCMTSFAAVSPTHPGHCCFIPASQECHAAEVAEWERQRDLRWRGQEYERYAYGEPGIRL